MSEYDPQSERTLSNKERKMTHVEVPILIVGGGGCGLSSSIFLSDFGIEHLLVERHPGTSNAPKASYLNQRTLEIFRQHGFADEVYRHGTPVKNLQKIRWRTSLTGNGPLDAKELCPPQSAHADYDKSPGPSTTYPQLRLEPLLRQQAERRVKKGTIRFSHELITLTQDAEGVTSTIRDRVTNETYTVRSKYVIAADAGKTVGPMVGINMWGPVNLLDVVSAYITTDLSKWWDDETYIYWFIHPERTGLLAGGIVVPQGPTWGKHSEEWIVHFAFKPDDPARNFDEAVFVPNLRKLLKVGDELDIKVNQINHWLVEGVIADQYRVGRIFIGGDAAHRGPPTTGLGLNTGIQDVHNLTWKLATVLKGQAGEGLFDSYQFERQPIAIRNVDWGLFTFQTHLITDAAIGVTSDMPMDLRRQVFEIFFSESPMGEARRARFEEVIKLQRSEFQAHDIELGYSYPMGAIVPDGSPPPPTDPQGVTYTPTTRPGHRLPHAWLEGKGKRVSTHDLVGSAAEFLLITGAKGAGWTAAAGRVSEALGLKIRTASIGPGADYSEDGEWGKVSEIADDGAILVRPDNHVAWRSKAAVEDPQGALTAALRTVLSRS